MFLFALHIIPHFRSPNENKCLLTASATGCMLSHVPIWSPIRLVTEPKYFLKTDQNSSVALKVGIECLVNAFQCCLLLLWSDSSCIRVRKSFYGCVLLRQLNTDAFDNAEQGSWVVEMFFADKSQIRWLLFKAQLCQFYTAFLSQTDLACRNKLNTDAFVDIFW